MNRTEQRERVFKLIFESISNKLTLNDLKTIMSDHNLDEHFIEKSMENFYKHYESISENISKVISLSSLDKAGKVDKSLIILGVNEMTYMKTPSSIVINEVVELAKKYSKKDSYKFINSILGQIYKINNE